MPTLNQAEEAFLQALRDYVDFRFLKGVDAPSLQAGDLLVSRFIEFLDSRPLRKKGTEETVTVLIEKMTQMKDGRGTGQPPPEPGR
jgi:hypothetical protein